MILTRLLCQHQLTSGNQGTSRTGRLNARVRRHETVRSYLAGLFPGQARERDRGRYVRAGVRRLDGDDPRAEREVSVQKTDAGGLQVRRRR